MKISELRAGMEGVDVEVTIQDLSADDYVESTSGVEHCIKKARVSDETGTTELILLDNKTGQVKPGGRYRVRDAHVSRVNGVITLQLTHFGQITPLE